MAVDQKWEHPRRYPRWAVGGRLTGRVGGVPKVSVVDISVGGALIEHSGPFQPGAILFMNLSFPGQEVGLKCRVVRSGPHRYEVLPGGTEDLLHRTGLEFVDISEVSHRIVNGYIEFLSGLQA